MDPTPGAPPLPLPPVAPARDPPAPPAAPKPLPVLPAPAPLWPVPVPGEALALEPRLPLLKPTPMPGLSPGLRARKAGGREGAIMEVIVPEGWGAGAGV